MNLQALIAKFELNDEHVNITDELTYYRGSEVGLLFHKGEFLADQDKDPELVALKQAAREFYDTHPVIVRINAFRTELEALQEKYQVILAHEDGHGAFLIEDKVSGQVVTGL